MADINSPPSDGSDEQNKYPDNHSNVENTPPSDDNRVIKTGKPPCPTTKKDHDHHKVERAKAYEESGDEFDHVSDPEEKFRLIMEQMVGMDLETFKKKYPPPKPTRESIGPEEAFKLLKELYEDTDDEDESSKAAPGVSKPTTKK